MSELPSFFCQRRVVEQLCALPRRPWEVGGWLLGYWSGSKTLVATHATPRGRRGTPFGVWINAERHGLMFDIVWEASGGRVTFIGDWHTHPGGPASLSKRDRRALAYLAAEDDFGTPEPLAGIVDLPRWPWSKRPSEVRFWLRQSDREVVELEPHLFDEMPKAAAGVPDLPWGG